MTEALKPSDLRVPGGPQTRTRAANARIRKTAVRDEPVRESVRAQGKRLVRQRRRAEDQFYIPREMVPQGVTYEWKAASVVNKPNTAHMVSLRANHWQPVLAREHPDLAAAGISPDAPIEKDGMMLMKRPEYLTREAQAEDFDLATEQIALKERSLTQAPKGQFSRQHPSAQRVTGINRSFEPMMDIPE